MGCMLPLFDMMNHKHDHVAIVKVENDQIVLYSDYDYQIGEEVFLNYGKLSN